MTGDLSATVEKLCRTSERDFVNPYEVLNWQESMNKDQWFMSPELISIYGTDCYDALSESERRVLSFYEAVNFFSLNIHGEKPLVEGLARRMYRKDTSDISAYLHHFLDEENKHMVYFGGFCTRYAGKIYPNKKVTFPANYAPGEEDFLFFAKVLIFEEIVDVYNVRMSTDARLNALAKLINLLHHRDEARHLVFGRKLVVELFNQYAPQWHEAVLQGVRDYLSSYFTATWKEYYNPDAYKDAGLDNVYELQEAALSCAAGKEHRQKVSAACVAFFLEHKMIEREPQL